MKSLSLAARTATVFDLENQTSYRYAELYAAEAAKPKNPRGLRLRDLYAYEHEREYLIIWEHGITAYYRSRQAPWQITPDDIERAFAGAKLLKSGGVR